MRDLNVKLGKERDDETAIKFGLGIRNKSGEK